MLVSINPALLCSDWLPLFRVEDISSITRSLGLFLTGGAKWKGPGVSYVQNGYSAPALRGPSSHLAVVHLPFSRFSLLLSPVPTPDGAKDAVPAACSPRWSCHFLIISSRSWVQFFLLSAWPGGCLCPFPRRPCLEGGTLQQLADILR